MHRYEGADAIVTWDASLCMHSAVCLRALPAVFDRDAKPWVRPDAASVDDLAAAIARCPSGALRIRRGEAAAGAPSAEAKEDAMNTTRLSPKGPYVCGGDLAIATASGTRTMSQATLCRCGGSANKPFCDGTHDRLRFDDAGMLPEGAVAGRAGPGRVTLSPQPNGPLKVEGPMTIASSDGRTTTGDPLFLCRCGGSANKPFCDGTHRRNGFIG